MKKTALWLIVLVFAGVCWADTVYMKDGREIEGYAKKKDGKVIIKLPSGKKIRVSEDDVLYIAKGRVRKKPAKPEIDLDAISTSQPAKPSSNPKEPATTPNKPNNTTKTAAPVIPGITQPKYTRRHTDLVSYSQATEPQQVIFLLMRRRGKTANQRLEDQITQHRALAHDRKRKIGSKWVGPDDFDRRRNAFVKYYKEACNSLREANKLREKKDLAKKKSLLKTSSGQLRQAVRAWADPLLRQFLMAQVELHDKQFDRAEILFSNCIKDVDFIAVFYQGRADARLALKRYDDALADYMIVMKLKPESKAALHILRQALKKVPGKMINSKQYKAAAHLCNQYRKNRLLPDRPNVKSWLLPDKQQTIRVDHNPLTTLPMDRLVIKKAIAVPIAQNHLIVDKEVVKDAAEIMVRLDENTYAPASIEKSRKSDLAIIKIVGYNFTPVKIVKAGLKPGTSLTAYSTDIFHDMGKHIRDLPITVKAGAEKDKISFSANLSPGEAAGPVFDKQGNLAGFLAGKLQYQTDNNPDRFLGPEQLAPILKRMKKASKARHRRIKHASRPKSIAGKTFLLYSVSAERLKKGK